MKRSLCVLLAACLTLLFSLPAAAQVPELDDIRAEAAILMDADTGQILYNKNGDKQMYPASITKIMTAMLVLEELNLNQTVTASAGAVDLPSWSSSAYIQAGERMTVEEFLYCMMLRSANEAANVLAEEVAGSQQAFADEMNRRAEELGARNTHFTNAHGLSSRSHYTTAYDMALITREAVHTPGFLDFFGAEDYTIPATNKFSTRIFANTHRMLLRNYGVYNSDVIGGKTGYTGPSGYTLVTVAEQNGRTLICVVLKSSSYYGDTQTLLDFGFDEFEAYTYPFESTRVEVPIQEGERETGVAYFYLPQSTTLLIHETVEPEEIVPEFHYPDQVNLGEEVVADIALMAPEAGAEGLPETLITIPLEPVVATFQIIEAEMPLTPVEPEAPPMLLRDILPWMLAAIACIWMLAWMIGRRVRGQRRRDRVMRTR